MVQVTAGITEKESPLNKLEQGIVLYGVLAKEEKKILTLLRVRSQERRRVVILVLKGHRPLKRVGKHDPLQEVIKTLLEVYNSLSEVVGHKVAISKKKSLISEIERLFTT